MKARVSLNLPNSLKRAAEDFAVKDGVSLNQYIALALAEKVGARGAADFFAERGKAGVRGAGTPRGLGRFERVGIGMRSVLVSALRTKQPFNWAATTLSSSDILKG